MESFKLKDLIHDKQPVISFNHLVVTETIRLYYLIDEHHCEFYCVQWTGNPYTPGYEYFEAPDVEVTSICKGVIYYDGLRHLYFGDEQTENYGYLFYPNPKDIILVMQGLLKLEKMTCPEHGLPDYHNK